MRKFIQADTEITFIYSSMHTRIRTKNHTKKPKTHRRKSILVKRQILCVNQLCTEKNTNGGGWITFYGHSISHVKG